MPPKKTAAKVPTARTNAAVARKKAKSRSGRAGLVFPVSRIQSQLRKGDYAPRISAGAAVYLAAALEYLGAELLELASSAAADTKKARITPRHVQFALRNDSELDEFCKSATVPGGGVMPHINRVLFASQVNK